MLRTTQIGYAGAAPELRYAPSGDAVANVNIATSEHWIDKETGEKKERTTWVSWEVWGKSAENLAKLVQKGSRVYIEGTIRNHQWEDKDTGDTKYRDRHVGSYWQLLDRKVDGAAPAEGVGSEPGKLEDIPQ